MKLTVLDVGGTEIKYSVMEENLIPCGSGTVRTPLESRDAFYRCVEEIYQRIGAGTEGVAMALPGIIDSDRGYCYTGGMLAFHQGHAVASELSERLGCPVHIENDGKCAALAEYTCGSLRGCRNAAVFLIGTGVGGGLIVNGQLLKGSHFSAGEFSFLMKEPQTPENIESFVGYSCSVRAFLALVRRESLISESEPLDGRMAFARIQAGDPGANRALRQFGRRVACEVLNLQTLLDAERVAIGGGISRQPLLIDSIRSGFAEILGQAPYLNGILQPTVEIVPCRFYNEANQIGAWQSYAAWHADS